MLIYDVANGLLFVVINLVNMFECEEIYIHIIPNHKKKMLTSLLLFGSKWKKNP